MHAPISKDIATAKNVIATQGSNKSIDDLFKLAKSLKNENDFGHARQVLKIARDKLPAGADEALKRKLVQQHALCTYKDPDLPIDERLDQALEILKLEKLNTTTDQETLGLAGAIYKRKWEVDGQTKHLETSLFYYRRGHEQGVDDDNLGYTGINAAFVLDLLAAEEESAEALDAGQPSEVAKERRQKAQDIRGEIVKKLEGFLENPLKKTKETLEKDWWFIVTLAEAYFGLQEYENARKWLSKAAEFKEKDNTKEDEGKSVARWEFETTARQLASLARLHMKGEGSLAAFERSPAWSTLLVLLKNNEACARTAFLGKVGLALSGGGFRASLFHIGVLAKLAELDMLRHVEVLSCVSGGSIIGAYYYLELRKFLQETADHKDAITRQNYVDIVMRVQEQFLEAVQRNIRTRVVLNPVSNLLMLLRPSYSRTSRLADLFDEEIFSKIADKDQKGDKPRVLNQLFVVPLNSDGKKDEKFQPKYDNWKRHAKVPTLILNATTLNTGHNWQFTASWMGEPPWSIVSEIDNTYRLRRMYYCEAPEKHRNVRLGQAVAASACVPGLFPPLALPGLYKGKTIRLVDGGVHDNQGISSLLEQGCTVLLVSDASGQMDAEDDPKGSMLQVPLRSTSILMSRVRGAQYSDLVDRKRSLRLRGLMFVHIAKDLDSPPVEWAGCLDPKLVSSKPLTSYNVHKEMQKRLASIRTDLDSFSQAEAYALMASGYLMTDCEFKKHIKGFPVPDPISVKWSFENVMQLLQTDPELTEEAKKFAKLLETASQQGFKVWRQSFLLKTVASLVGLALGFVLLWSSIDKILMLLQQLPLASIGVALVAITVILILIALTGSLLSLIHLKFFDKKYLSLGEIDEIVGEKH